MAPTIWGQAKAARLLSCTVGSLDQDRGRARRTGKSPRVPFVMEDDKPRYRKADLLRLMAERASSDGPRG
ncbi:hypothetical protein [Amaricoccus solimangrovi]|uniref:DNA-binding protein n=1 Tax=Amaricoccus solimangrovi TaxID=2589815 RepID=A0A501WLF5_9RHOB|nr:hypothetical protein [Amaricoccus solimangrovi]TPE47881.1 hypothetical protein FJM51_19280 [Amaricoccus solimangrovi]